MTNFEVYDTVKVYQNKICFLEEHIDRFNNTLEHLYNKRFNNIDIKKGCLNIIRGQNIEEGAVRFSYDVNKDIIEFKTRTTSYNKKNNNGMSLGYSLIRKDENDPVTLYKTNKFSFLKERSESDFNELISLNSMNYITEGSITNIFIIKNKHIYTPIIESGLLNGIMRQKVIDICHELNIPITENLLTKEDLINADEIFITNALMGVVPINKVDEKVFNINSKNLAFNIKKRVINKWKKEVKNG